MERKTIDGDRLVASFHGEDHYECRLCGRSYENSFGLPKAEDGNEYCPWCDGYGEIKDGKCFLCGKDGRAVRLERHHLIEGTGRRQLSEKYGLVVMLCPDCHRNGARAAHRNAKTALFLHQYAERLWIEKTGGTIDEFIKVFGKNYL